MNNEASDESPLVAGGVAPRAPASPHVTAYDRRHHITYLRLLDAESVGMHWREAAASVLSIDPDTDRAGAHAVWRSHLDRARWMTTTGFRELLEAGQAARKAGKS